MEEMLSNLISITGNMNKKLQDSIEELRLEQKELRDEQKEMRCESEKRHHELLEKLNTLQSDQDYIWEKSVRNEREIARIKTHLHQ